MRILFIAPNPPSPQRVRPYGFVRALAARGHQLLVAAPHTTATEQTDLAGLRQPGIDVLTAPLGRGRRLMNVAQAGLVGEPMQARYAWSPALMAAIDARLNHGGEHFDVVHVEHLRGSRYALSLAPKLPVVWDSVDCISTLFAETARRSASPRGRWMARLELGPTRRFEGQMPHLVSHTIVTSPVDAEALAALAAAFRPKEGPGTPERGRSEDLGPAARQRTAEWPGPPISVIANGVDLEYFRPQALRRDQATIVFSGRLSYHANVTAALYLVDEVMPRVWAAHPEARLVLAGADPAPQVRRAVDDSPRSNRIELTGTVDDLRPFLAQATVAAAPVVYGAGVQNKLLEAMAMATPVVTSPLALRGLAVLADRDGLVAGDAEGMAKALVAVIEDAALAARLGAAGRAYVERHHAWDGAAAQLERVYEAVV